MSVCLLAVRLLYRFYVFGHLSKWFTFSLFLFLTFCRVVVFYACTQPFNLRTNLIVFYKINRIFFLF